MHILVTNDDGVHAPGLLALAQAARKITEKVTILAPNHNWSASGHVKTLHRPLRVSEVHLSGINPNANLGHDVTYSGTVTAAMEAAIWGVPGIAVSLDTPEDFHGPIEYQSAAEAARRIIEWLWSFEDIPQELVLNVNVPYGPIDEFKGFNITRQGLRIYRDELVKRLDPRGKPYYWIGGKAPTGVEEPGTDFGGLWAGYVSITPLQLDLTSQALHTWMDTHRFEKDMSSS